MTTAHRKLDHVTCGQGICATGCTITEGMAIYPTGANNTWDTALAGSDLALAVAKEDATAGQLFNFYYLGPVIPVLVGTGGATMGKKAKLANDGFTDAPTHDSSGGTDDVVYGSFVQTGAAGVMVGMIPAIGNRGSA
jgi:hypothetical protein